MSTDNKDKIKSIVLSTSAIATAIGAMAQLVEQNPGVRIHLRDTSAELSDQDGEAVVRHRESMRGAVSGVAAEMAIRQHMGIVIPALDIDPESMNESWIRLSQIQKVVLTEERPPLDNIITLPVPPTPNKGFPELLRGPHTDSTFDNMIFPDGQYVADSCYSNCHSACHGSRGWR